MLLLDGRKVFVSTTLWRLCGFRHSEKIMKARLALCVMVTNHFTNNEALNIRRERFKGQL